MLLLLQGHPKAGWLWEQSIDEILTNLDFKSTTHERNVTLTVPISTVTWFSFAAKSTASTKSSRELLIASSACLPVRPVAWSPLSMVLTPTKPETTPKSRPSFPSQDVTMLENRGWNNPAPTESSCAPIEPLPSSIQTQLDKPTSNKQHQALTDKMYRSVLGELIYAYATTHLGIAYACCHQASPLAQHPCGIHYQALKRFVAIFARPSTGASFTG
jgi:hypothetical protein